MIFKCDLIYYYCLTHHFLSPSEPLLSVCANSKRLENGSTCCTQAMEEKLLQASGNHLRTQIQAINQKLKDRITMSLNLYKGKARFFTQVVYTFYSTYFTGGIYILFHTFYKGNINYVPHF